VKKRNLTLLSFAIIILILIFDQIIKFLVKTNMTIGEQIPVIGNWFQLYFIENEGMAFGISFGESIGKLILSLFRVGIAGFLIYYVLRLIKNDKAELIVVIIFSLIIAGALGNILDSLFYGLIFNESTPFTVASLFPDGGGYGKFFLGRVVDMFYLKLFRMPDWFPLWGGSYFFPAIFNVADACVTVGIILMLIFNKRIFIEEKKEKSGEIIG
jgi:signal peptidase II